MGNSVDVLVVGAGPAGLTAALELQRHGLTFRLVDQLEEPAPWSKAQVIHARTLEIFETLGVADELRSRGKMLHGFNLYAVPAMKRMAHITLSPPDSFAGSFLSLSQHETEDILRGALAARGGAVERPVRLDSFSQDDRGVRADLVHKDGHREQLEARWLLGCDGAHSTARHALGLAFEGSTYEQHIIQADVRIDLPLHVDDDEVVGFIGEGGLLALFPLPGERRYRMLIPQLDGKEREPVLSTFQELMRDLGPPGAVVSDPRWMVDFRIHCRMVQRYRVESVFLAGDAAHIHSPAGGQGMNTGIQDVFNLVWKLALVHRHRALPALLDSYDAERRPVAAATLGLTDRATRGLVTVVGFRHPLAQALRNRVMGFVADAGILGQASQRASMLDIGYPDSPAVAQDRPAFYDAHVMPRDEHPSLRDWIDFGHGPAPGQRAPDARLDPADEASPRLHDLLRKPRHSLLLFDGAAHTEAGYANLASIARRVRERLGDLVDPHILVPLPERPAALAADEPVLLDPHGSIHQRYGARSECLYLLRPDGHIAYRSQPASADRLLAYLERIFA